MIKIIIFDWKRTLYDPESNSLMDGVIGLLSFLCNKNIKLVLVGKGGIDMYKEVVRLKVKKYFSNIVFQEGKKDFATYKKFTTTNPQETVFIGDRVRSELMIGNKLGAITIWLKQGKFLGEEPLNDLQKPLYTVTSIEELGKLLDSKL